MEALHGKLKGFAAKPLNSNLSKCLTDVTAPSIPTALNKGHKTMSSYNPVPENNKHHAHTTLYSPMFASRMYKRNGLGSFRLFTPANREFQLPGRVAGKLHDKCHDLLRRGLWASRVRGIK
jgi:hypothetical protein